MVLYLSHPKEKLFNGFGKKTWLHIPIQAVVASTLPFLCIAYGETKTSAAIAGMLNAVTPLFTFVFSLIFLPRDKDVRRKILALVLGSVGVVLILSPWASTGAGQARYIGSLVVLCASGFYAYGFVYTKKYLGTVTAAPLVLAFLQISFAALLAVPALVLFHAPRHPHGSLLKAIAAIVVLGVVQTGMATLMFHRIVKALGATASSFVTYVIPVVAAISGIVFLGNRLGISSIVGAAIVLGSVALIAAQSTRVKGAKTVEIARKL